MVRMFLGLGLLMITGCTTGAFWVEQTYNPERSGAIGIEDGHPMTRGKQEDDAQRKMDSFCAPMVPQVISKSRAGGPTGYYASGNFIVPISDSYTVLKFKCRSDMGPSPASSK